MLPQQSRLDLAIARARAAVHAAPGRVTVSTLTADAAPIAPRVRVLVQTLTPLPAAPPAPSCAPVVADLLAGLDLKPAERRAFGLLHRLALAVAAARGYRATPTAVVFHLPASLLALAVGVSRRHLYRLLPALADAGLLAHGGHASKVGGMNLFDGCLFAVKVTPSAAPPRLRAEDWRHSWRDFVGDLKVKHTAAVLMSQLQTQEQDAEGIFGAAERWAVTPGTITPVTLVETSDTRDLIYSLPALAEAHAEHRSRLIGEAASTLAHALNDPQSRRWYALLLHRAVAAEFRGIRALALLSAALTRVLVDVAEWSDLRSPGALLVARLRVAGVLDVLNFA